MKSVQRCIALAQLLVEQNFPAIAIHRAMPQDERYKTFNVTVMILGFCLGAHITFETLIIIPD